MKLPSGNKINALGVMSGTSLDGMDLALVTFELLDNIWKYKIIKTKTYDYSIDWSVKLKNAHNLSGEELTNLHHQLGILIGENANDFLNGANVDLIASHGHTIFHQPKKGFSLQIGSGAQIAAITNKLVINDFRSLDIALGGQGAPLVPIGDQLLFSEYDYCLNLGGFANISFEKDQRRIAYDITAVNFVLNHLSHKLGRPFDENGRLGEKGNINENLLNQLNDMEYYKKSYPKSLGREWVEQSIFPILDNFEINIYDKLSTYYEHIALQIVKNIEKEGLVLITGGGAYNSFLISIIEKYSKAKIIIPDNNLIEFKEALIFAFLGVLKYYNINNTLCSVTDAKRDSCGGTIIQSV